VLHGRHVKRDALAFGHAHDRVELGLERGRLQCPDRLRTRRGRELSLHLHDHGRAWQRDHVGRQLRAVHGIGRESTVSSTP
jgi:hypothetical protein